VTVHGWYRRILGLVIVALLLALPMVGSTFYVELGSKALIFAIFAMSLDLLVGFTGLVSLGHAAYFGVAAYTLARLSPKADAANLWLTLAASFGVASMTALVIGFFVLRTRGIYFIMVTLAFAQMLFSLFSDTSLGGGSDGIYVNVRPVGEIFGTLPFTLDDSSHLYWFILAVALIVWITLSLLLRSPFGRVLAGIRSNEHRMIALGFPTFRYKLAAFTIAGGMAGMAGYLYAVLYGFVTPELLSWHKSGDVLLMIILGGIGNLVGACVGALAFVAMQEVFEGWSKHWQLIMGAVIIASVLFLPGGLSAVPRRIRSLWDRGHRDG
jgi:branched-chain amino acid transport system permease protein